MAGTTLANTEFELFSCTVGLTEEGLGNKLPLCAFNKVIGHTDEILTLIYQYLNIIKEKGINKEIYDELHRIGELEFRFIEKSQPASYTSTLAGQMQVYPPEHILCGPHLFAKYDEPLIRECLNNLNADNMIVQIVSKKFEGHSPLREEWYDIEYSKQQLASDLLAVI
jgi:secreted Zn-dependent insulinase-like peptidase